MTVNQRTDRIANITQEMIEAQRQSYEALTDSFIAFQKRNVRFFQSGTSSGADYLHNQRAAEAFAESARAQQEGLRKLGEEWVGLYEDAATSLAFHAEEAAGQDKTQEGPQKKAWDELDHRRNAADGRFGPGEEWDESAHTRDTEGQFT